VRSIVPERFRGRVDVRVPLRPGGIRLRRQHDLPFPLGEPGCRLVRRAAPVMPAALRALGLIPGDRVLVPALHHGPEVQTLRRARLECRTYGAAGHVAPDEDELEELVDPRVRALYLIHHLGFPQSAAHWSGWCRERGLVLIEDCTHAWPARDGDRPVGSSGGLAIFSLSAMLPLPLGDAVVARLPNGASAWGRHGTTGCRIRLAAARHVDVDIAGPRRANYRRLVSEVADSVARPFFEVPDGASPWLLPVVNDRPAALLARLERSNVSAVRLWAGGSSRRVPWLAGEAVGVPVHQWLHDSDLDRIATAVRGPARRPSIRLDILPDFDAAGDAWDELAAASGNLFATREWLSTWCRHHGAGEPLLVACRIAGGRIAAILPLEITSLHGVRILRFLGHGPSDQMGPICHRSDVGTAARALREILRRPPRRFQLFVGRHLLGTEDWASLLGAKRVGAVANPVLPLRGSSWDDVLATFSPKLRREIRYDVRRLEREHAVEYRHSRDPASLRADLDVLFRLHATQWANGSYFLVHEAFHREFAAIAQERGWLRLWIIEADGRPVAAKYNFRFGDTELSYQAGREPQWRGASLGLVNVANAMRAALEEGAREYRFLRGSERYKFRFPVVDPGLHTVARGSGAIGRAALAAGAALEQAEALQAARRTILRHAGSVTSSS
jgi:CelD/BcsL family acetyltransferase involved in cellulose biosynthesis